MGICNECDLSRMDIGEKKKCTRDKKGVIKCSEYLHHCCRSCSNMMECSYIRKTGEKDPHDYKFITYSLPVKKGVIILHCQNYKYQKNEAHGSLSAATKICAELLGEIVSYDKKSNLEFI